MKKPVKSYKLNYPEHVSANYYDDCETCNTSNTTVCAACNQGNNTSPGAQPPTTGGSW